MPVLSQPEAAEAPLDINDVMYGHRTSIHVLEPFIGMSGCILLREVFRLYAKQTGVILPLLIDGNPCLIMHECNNRHQESTEHKYMMSIIAKGNAEGVRGEPWAVQTNDPNIFKMISFGTMTRAIYKAWKKAGMSSKFVQATMEAGLRNGVESDASMPLDVCEFLRDYHNAFHGGSPFNLTLTWDLACRMHA